MCIYRLLNAVVALSRNCPFGANTMFELKNVNSTSYNNVIWQGVFQLTSVPVLLDIIVTF